MSINMLQVAINNRLFSHGICKQDFKRLYICHIAYSKVAIRTSKMSSFPSVLVLFSAFTLGWDVANARPHENNLQSRFIFLIPINSAPFGRVNLCPSNEAVTCGFSSTRCRHIGDCRIFESCCSATVNTNSVTNQCCLTNAAAPSSTTTVNVPSSSATPSPTIPTVTTANTDMISTITQTTVSTVITTPETTTTATTAETTSAPISTAESTSTSISTTSLPSTAQPLPPVVG
ncbi:hypothetical protein CHUAL_000288 [Chamberlinius hualienensis]